MKRAVISASFATATFFCSTVAALAEEKPTHPNVILVIADDLGYGDISCYGGKIKTPNIDRIAKQGLRFTRGYAASATSTPSRYGILTGVYPWRGKVAILPGDSPLIIPTDRPTIATMFQNCGYKTCAIGKWHLGLGKGDSNWNKPISPGPKEIGFDNSFIMAATNDRVPCVYFSNGSVVGLDPSDPIEVNYQKNFPGEPTGKSNPEMLKMRPSHGHADTIVNGISRIGFMKGGHTARWVDEQMSEVLSTQALKFVHKNKNNPFFMYYALHQPHVPRVPNEKFAGKSGLGPRGDVILEADSQVGELLDLLEKEGLSENTLLVFTSDNGPVLDDGYMDDAIKLAKEKNFSPTGGLRGGKYSLYEGGTRVPFIVSWPGKVTPGVSSVPVSQLDFFASFASLVGGKVPEITDSQNHLDVFLGSKNPGRKNFVIEANGSLAFREGDYVYIPAHPNKNAIAGPTGIETGNAKEDALYKISDPHSPQKENLVKKDPKRVQKMREGMLKETGGRI